MIGLIIFSQAPIITRMKQGEIIRREREKAGIKQLDLAATLGVSQSFMAHIEAGKRPLPLAYLSKLPDQIRRPVIDAMLADMVKAINAIAAQAAELKRMR